MNKLSLKFQIFQTICMSDHGLCSTPQEILEATLIMYDYITEGVSMNETSKDNVSLFEVH